MPDSQFIIFPFGSRQLRATRPWIAAFTSFPCLSLIVVASMSAGYLISKIGYYKPLMIFGVSLTAIGAGLLNALQIDTSVGRWVGF